jgi:glucan endo-1,3-alpha-glucosidase
MHRSCRHLYHFFAALGFFFVADPSAGFAVSPDVPHLVFAHYMVCCPRLGHDATVEDFKSEIRDAQTRKLDGFVLNLGNWSKESYYRDITRRMFQAAKELSSGFKLFFSFDGTPPADALVMLSEFGEHPNYFRVNHRPVISSYSGSPKWGFDMAKKLNDRGIEPLLILNYQYLSDFPFAKNYITPTAGFLDRLYAENPILDGYFFFALDLGYKPAPTVIPLVAERSRAAGKISMVGISPFYRGLRGNFRVFEGGGFRGMAAQWMAAIQSGVNWVEIVTWNDWGEATYVAPFGEPRDQDLWNYQWGPLLAHVGFLDASAYFIDWFKTGVAPAIQNDRIFYFYRLHK